MRFSKFLYLTVSEMMKLFEGFIRKVFIWLKVHTVCCIDMLFNRNDWKVEGDWNKLWSLLIPPEVKHFMWRLRRDCLRNRQKK
jgi:hypothetical protein